MRTRDETARRKVLARLSGEELLCQLAEECAAAADSGK